MPVGSPCASRTMVPPATSFVAVVIPAARSAAPFASDMWPSSRVTHTGLFGVTESIQSRRGSSPPQSSWSQLPFVIHAPGGSVFAYSPMRRANSRGVFASRSCTDARPNPAERKCTCESMNPGTTIIPWASITRVADVTDLRTSALDPTTVIRSPLIAIASAHGRRESPVQMRALTTARLIASAGG
jgi:hypothetical protein